MHHAAEKQQRCRSRLRERRGTTRQSEIRVHQRMVCARLNPDGNYKKPGDNPAPRRRAGFSSGELGKKPSAKVGRK